MADIQSLPMSLTIQRFQRVMNNDLTELRTLSNNELIDIIFLAEGVISRCDKAKNLIVAMARTVK